MDNTKLIAQAQGWDADAVSRHALSALDTIRRLADALEAAEAELKDLRDEVEEDGKVMRSLRRHRDEAEAELTRRDTVIGHDELSTLCLSYLRPPKFSGGSWTLNPDALATAILERLAAAPVSLEAANTTLAQVIADALGWDWEPAPGVPSPTEAVSDVAAAVARHLSLEAVKAESHDDRCPCGLTATEYFAERRNRG